jgi:hypothetical protein
MSGRRARPALEWPRWLVELAARDDPPTELDDALLVRMARAGATELPPADGETFHHVDEAVRAAAIGAAGPGFGVLEPLVGEAAPAAAALERLCSWLERFDRLRLLRLASIDMDLAASTARSLADRDGPARLFERVLETGLVTTYARPYLESNRPRLGKRWRPESAEDRACTTASSTGYGTRTTHAERTRFRTLIDTTAFLGLDGPPIFAEAWNRLKEHELAQLADLADRQAARFAAAADAIGAQLGEQRDGPSYPHRGPRATLWFDHGVEAAARELRARARSRRDEGPGTGAGGELASCEARRDRRARAAVHTPRPWVPRPGSTSSVGLRTTSRRAGCNTVRTARS